MLTIITILFKLRSFFSGITPDLKNSKDDKLENQSATLRRQYEDRPRAVRLYHQ